MCKYIYHCLVVPNAKVFRFMSSQNPEAGNCRIITPPGIDYLDIVLINLVSKHKVIY
jgi:hypothetical protein